MSRSISHKRRRETHALHGKNFVSVTQLDGSGLEYAPIAASPHRLALCAHALTRALPSSPAPAVSFSKWPTRCAPSSSATAAASC
jgi:hypothetical protein